MSGNRIIYFINVFAILVSSVSNVKNNVYCCNSALNYLRFGCKVTIIFSGLKYRNIDYTETFGNQIS